MPDRRLVRTDEQRAEDVISRVARLWMRWQGLLIVIGLALLALDFRLQTPAQVNSTLDGRIRERDQEVRALATQLQGVEATLGRMVLRLDRQDRLTCLKDDRTAMAAGIPCALLLSNGKEYDK